MLLVFICLIAKGTFMVSVRSIPYSNANNGFLLCTYNLPQEGFIYIDIYIKAIIVHQTYCVADVAKEMTWIILLLCCAMLFNYQVQYISISFKTYALLHFSEIWKCYNECRHFVMWRSYYTNP